MTRLPALDIKADLSPARDVSDRGHAQPAEPNLGLSDWSVVGVVVASLLLTGSLIFIVSMLVAAW